MKTFVYFVYSYPQGESSKIKMMLRTESREEAESKMDAEKLAGRVAWYNTVPLYKEKA